MGNEVQKRVAADGTQRGLHRKKKNRATELMEQMQEDAERLFGIKNHDPVRALNTIGLMAMNGYPAVDTNGNPIYDQNGEPVTVPPDFNLATAAFSKAAPYVRSQLRPVDPEDDSDSVSDATDARQKTIEMAQRLGLPTEHLEEEPVDGDD